MGILQDLNPFNPNSPISLFPGPPLTKQQIKQGPTTTPGSRNLILTQQQQQTGENAVKALPFGVGSAITSVDDFLAYIAWIFYPLNILRAAEFFVGTIIFYLGIRPYLTQGSPSLASTGAGLRRVMQTVTEPTPIGRARRQRQGRRMGSREGQRESSRMEARRIATRTERERSANERARREQRAKRRARGTNP